jgi:hypothetical protein
MADEPLCRNSGAVRETGGGVVVRCHKNLI